MLILSRRAQETVVFPGLGITIEVLDLHGKVAKLGVTAPAEIPILRGEVCDTANIAEQAESRRHEFRNRLNAVLLRISLMQKQLEIGLSHDVIDGLKTIRQELTDLETTAQPAAKSTKRAAKSLQLLVVEDDVNERELLAGLLRLHGFQVSTASDGAEAIAYISQHSVPDCVLMDINMPRVDGLRAVLSIRSDQRCRNARVFAVSGREPSGDAIPAELEGFDAWFTKPLEPSKLLQAIAAL